MSTAFLATGLNRNIGGHARLEQQIVVVDLHHHHVGDHILDRDRGVADLGDAALEGALRVGIHRKADRSGPVWARLISDSSTLVSICILVRSWAMVNRVGVWKEAATVWPTSTLREITTPSTGERMVAFFRLVSACIRAPRVWVTLASAALMPAWAESWAVCEASKSLWEIIPWASSWRLRSRVRLGIGQGHLGLLQSGLGVQPVAAGLFHLGQKQGRVDLGDGLALLHPRVVINIQFVNRAGDLGTDQDRGDGIDRAGG